MDSAQLCLEVERSSSRRNRYRDVELGEEDGPDCARGMIASVHFESKMLNGRPFESTTQNFGSAVRFVVGEAEMHLRGQRPVNDAIHEGVHTLLFLLC